MPRRSRASTAMRCILACWAISISESTAGLNLRVRKQKSGRNFCRPARVVRCLSGRAGMTLFRMDEGGGARAVADDLQHRLFILGAVEMMPAGGMFHETARFQWHGHVRIENIPGACPPGALQYDGVTVFGMKMRPRHYPGRKLNAHDVNARFRRVAGDNRDFHAIVAWRVFPLH